MPKHSDAGGMYSGSKKSSARSAFGNNKGGNLGNKIGDKGKKNPIGNARTKCDADRFK